MPEHPAHGSETGHNQSPTGMGELEHELQAAVAETQRSATNQLQDVLGTHLTERQAIIARALGPEGYAEVMAYIHEQAAVDRVFAEDPETAELSLDGEPSEFPPEERTGPPDSLQNFEAVEEWVDNQVFDALAPYELRHGQLFSQSRHRDQGQDQITITRYFPDSNAGVIREVTATGVPQQSRDLRKSLSAQQATAAARPLTPGESFDLETKLHEYHDRMTEIADLTPEQILEHANPHSDGPEGELV